MIVNNVRRYGVTYTLIKAIAHELNQDKAVTVGGLKSPDLYLRMLADQGCIAEAEEIFTSSKISIGFIFKLKK